MRKCGRSLDRAGELYIFDRMIVPEQEGFQ